MYKNIDELCELFGEDKREALVAGSLNGMQIAKAKVNEKIIYSFQKLIDSDKKKFSLEEVIGMILNLKLGSEVEEYAN